MSDIREIYKRISQKMAESNFKINENIILPCYMGYSKEGNLQFSIVSKIDAPNFGSTKLITVRQGREDENIFWSIFILNDSSATNVFLTLIEDLIDSIREENDQMIALNIMKNRLYIWKKLLNQNNAFHLTDSKRIGLFGELLFLKKIIIPEYGIYDGLRAWSGPDGTKKDFSINDKWFEIKTIYAGNDSIKISSVDQLDSDNAGYLCICKIEEMSLSFTEEYSSLNDIFTYFVNLIKDAEQLDDFIDKLNKVGFAPGDRDNDTKYKLVAIDKYKVEDDFPRLRLSDVKYTEIRKLTYELSIGDLVRFKEN